MTDAAASGPAPDTAPAPPPSRRPLRVAQLLLVLAAGGLWGSSRLPWLVVRSFDGLGQPRTIAVSGATWSTALVPTALLTLAAAVAAVAVRGWALRALAVLLGAVSLAAGYLAVGMWVLDDIQARAADVAGVSVTTLLGVDHRYGGPAVAVAAALAVLVAAVLLMRSAAGRTDDGAARKYAAPAARRDAARREPGAGALSERMIWDALDEGCDPTDGTDGTDAPGR